LENIQSDTGLITGALQAEVSNIKSSKKVYSNGDILYGKLRPNLNKVYLANHSGICSTDIFVLRKTRSEIVMGFFSVYLRTKKFNSSVLLGVSGAQLPRVSWSYFSNLRIPYPPIKTQQFITNKLEEEGKIVEANRHMIKIFEEKTEDKIAEVWGEAEENINL